MSASLVGYLALNAALWGLSYLLRDNEEEQSDKQYDSPSGVMKKAVPGDVVPIVFGRCLVPAHPIFFAANFVPQIGVFELPITAQLSVCLIPNTTDDVEDFSFGHIYIGGKRVRGIAWLDENPTYTLRIDDKNFWGGEDKGGGIGIGNNGGLGIGSNRGLVHLIRGQDFSDLGTFNAPAESAARAMLALQIISEQTSDDDIANGIGGNPNLASVIVERFVFGESQGGSWASSLPSFSIEAVCQPSYPGMLADVSGYEITDPDYGPFRSPGGVLLGGALWEENAKGDANPASVLYCVLTDDVVGASLSPGDIDFPSFVAAAATLSAEGNGISLMIEEPTALKDIIKTILTQIDGVLFMDPETQVIKLKLAREDYGSFPYATLDVIDESNCEKIVEHRIGNWDDTYNQVRVEFNNRAKDYTKDAAITQDLSGSLKMGRTRDITFTYPGVKTMKLAKAIAARDLKHVAVPTLSVTLQVNRSMAHLTPGSVFLWNWSQYNVVGMVMRVMQVGRGVLENGMITIQCVQEKDAIVVSTFGDSGPGEVYTPPAPEFPFDIGVWEPPNTGGFGGGFSTWGDAPNGRMLMAVAAGADQAYSFIEVSTDFGQTFDRISSELANTPHAVLSEDVALQSGVGRHYDTTVGILVSTVTADINLGPFTEAEIRNGDNLLLIGDETLSFESATDLGGGFYRLNNIWRGLLDSSAEEHVRGQTVFFLSDVDQQRTMTNIRPGVEGQIKFRVRANTGVELQHVGDATYVTADFKKRAKKPPVPTNFTLTDPGIDDISALGDVEYSYDPLDNTAVVVQQSTGGLSSELGSSLPVYSNDVLATWARRLMVPTKVVRGDEADEDPSNMELATYRIEGRAIGGEWEILQDTTFDGVALMSGPNEFATLALQDLGLGEVRLCAVHEDEQTGEPLCATNGDSIKVDMVAPRELLQNGQFRPSWDISGASSGAAYGRGKKVAGNGSTLARGWTSVGPLSPVFGVPAVPYEQGDGSSGHAFWLEEGAGTNEYALVQQIVPVPWIPTDTINGTNAKAVVEFSHYRDILSGTDNFYSVSIESYSEMGVLLDSSYATDQALASDADGWVRIVTSLNMPTPGAASVKLTLGLRSDTIAANPSAITRAKMSITPNYVGQFLTPYFLFGGSLAGYTTTGTWTLQESLGGIQRIQWVKITDTIVSVFPHCVTPASGEANIMFTEVLPDTASPGDLIRASVWVCRTEVGAIDNTAELKLTTKDSGSTVLATSTTGEKSVSAVDRWTKMEIWLRVPESCQTIDWELNFVVNSGSGVNMGWDQPSFEIFKADLRPTVLDYSTPAAQKTTFTAQDFAAACKTPQAKPYALFNFNNGTGVAIADSIRKQTFDLSFGVEGADFTRSAPSPGTWDGVGYVQEALELSKVLGGVACSDTSFMDPQNKSIGIYLEFRMRDFGHTGISNIVSKINGRPITADGAGFHLYHDASTNRIYFYVASDFASGNALAATVYLQLPVGMDAGAHWAYFKFDRTTALLSCFSDLGVGTADDLSAFVLEEFSNVVDKVHLGANPDMGGAYDEGFKSPFQLRVLSFLRGGPAEAFTPESGAALWVHGTDPNETFPLTTSMLTQLSMPVSDSEVVTFSGSDITEAKMAISYWDTLVGGNALALSAPMPTQNLIPYAEDFTHASWTKINLTPTPMYSPSPRGYLEATRLAQTAIGGYVQRTITGLVPGSEFTVSMYLRNTGSAAPVQVTLLESDLTSEIDTQDFITTTEMARFQITGQVQAGQTSIGIRIYGAQEFDAADECAIFGLQMYLHQNGGGQPVVPNYDATLNTSPLVSFSRTGMDPNALGTADEGRLEAVLAMPKRLTGGGSRNIVRLSGAAEVDERHIFLSVGAGEANQGFYNFTVNDDGAAEEIALDHSVAVAQDTESSLEVSWRDAWEVRNESGNAVINHDGLAAEDSLSFFTAGPGLVDLHVASGPTGDSFDGGVQSIKIYGNGSPAQVSSPVSTAVRIYPDTADEWKSRFIAPLVTSIWPLQREDSLQEDVLSTNHMHPIGTPVFGAAGDTRKCVLFDSTLDRIEMLDPDKLNPDGVKDMTYIIRCFLPTYPGLNTAIFSKRGGVDFPGFSVYMSPSGHLSCVQDGGGPGDGRNDITMGISHQNQYVDLAYVIDRSGNNEGRLESNLGTVVGSLAAIQSLASDTPLAIGRAQYEGRNGFVGLRVTYFAACEGTAMTRPELLDFWATQLP